MVYANDEIRPLLEQLGNELRFVLITSQAAIKPLSEADVAEGELAGLAVKVERAEGENAHVAGTMQLISVQMQNTLSVWTLRLKT